MRAATVAVFRLDIHRPLPLKAAPLHAHRDAIEPCKLLRRCTTKISAGYNAAAPLRQRTGSTRQWGGFQIHSRAGRRRRAFRSTGLECAADVETGFPTAPRQT